MSDNNAVIVERRDRVMIITLNRPEAMNAINGDLSHGLWNAVQELNDDPGLTAGVLTGAGKGFSSGMDLKAFAAGEDIGPMQEFIQAGAEKPLIAAVEGFAIAGGLELALSCDLMVAGESAKFGIREVKVGLFAAGGGVMRLPARVGYAKAMEMAVTGDNITAQDALDFGLLSQVTDDGAALDAARRLGHVWWEAYFLRELAGLEADSEFAEELDRVVFQIADGSEDPSRKRRIVHHWTARY